MIRTPRDRDVLSFDPWGDDSNYRVLDNRMVVTRCAHECAICFEAIPAGSRVRAQREAYDGKAMTFRFCEACCVAMGLCCGDHDALGFELLELRTSMGMVAAERTRVQTSAQDPR